MEKAKLMIRGVFTQLRQLWKLLLFLYIIILLMFTALHTISRSTEGVTLSYFTRDISAIGNLPFFAGLVSQIGGLLWSAAVAVCLFTYFVLKKKDPNARAPRQFLLHAAILTGILLLDDFFLFHEDIGPDFLHISEKAIVLAYLIFALVFLVLNFKEILASEHLILNLALAWFGISIFLDAANLDKYERYGLFFSEQFQIFLEDGFKFVGVTTWLVYFARYGYQKLRP